MERRQLGTTGLLVSPVGFGDPVPDGIAAVHTALKLGINVFDTSPFYGLTKSEALLGEALEEARVPRGDYVLATKCGRYGATDFDFSAKRITESVRESLQRLRTDYIDVLHCHDVEFAPSAEYIVRETLPALRKLKERGIVRHVGITGLPLEIYEEILEQGGAADVVDVVLSYCHYTLLDTTLAGKMPYLVGRGLGVFNASPLAMGLLTEAGPPDWHPASKAAREAARRGAALCRARGADIADVALQYSLHLDERVASTFVGLASAAQVENAVAQMLRGPADPGLVSAVRAACAPVLDQTWPSGRHTLLET
eukprot:tig00021127_g18789.t1